MVCAKNYETASTFVKVIPRKLLASFFLFFQCKEACVCVVLFGGIMFIPLLVLYYGNRTFRHFDVSLLGRFATRTFRPHAMDDSLPPPPKH